MTITNSLLIANKKNDFFMLILQMQKETTIEDLYNYYRGSILRSYLEINKCEFSYPLPEQSENIFEKKSLYYNTDTE